MAEEDLKKAILERVQQEKEGILNQAKKEQEELLRQTKAEADSFKERYLIQIKKRCQLLKTKELNQINLEIKRQILETKEKKISQVFSLVKQELLVIHQQREHYKSIFRQLLEESLEGLNKNTTIKFKVNPSDKQLALETLEELKLDAQLETLSTIEAGLELCDLEENATILNTFESRLRKLYPELRREISKILFEDL